MSEEVRSADGARCGSLIAHEHGRDYLCDLPQGHPSSRVCRPSVADMHAFNRGVIEDFRAGLLDRDPNALILLTTVGARSGRSHTSPVASYSDGDRMLVVASGIAAQKHPNWYRNLVANPRVTVEAGRETYQGLAIPLVGADRDRAWSLLVTLAPFLVEHQAGTARTLPIVAITRV